MPRYYAQFKEFDSSTWSPVWRGAAWQVFDREQLGQQGDVFAICACPSRDDAFKVRDVLNAQESRRLEEWENK